jgi:hypothetical protein
MDHGKPRHQVVDVEQQHGLPARRPLGAGRRWKLGQGGTSTDVGSISAVGAAVAAPTAASVVA